MATCNSGKCYIVGNTTRCASCIQGFYGDDNDRCFKCPVGCLACDSPQICNSCNPGFFINNGLCQNKANSGKKEEGGPDQSTESADSTSPANTEAQRESSRGQDKSMSTESILGIVFGVLGFIGFGILGYFLKRYFAKVQRPAPNRKPEEKMCDTARSEVLINPSVVKPIVDPSPNSNQIAPLKAPAYQSALGDQNIRPSIFRPLVKLMPEQTVLREEHPLVVSKNTTQFHHSHPHRFPFSTGGPSKALKKKEPTSAVPCN